VQLPIPVLLFPIDNYLKGRQALGDPVHGWARDPVAGIAAHLPSETLQTIFTPLVAILAATILLTATNAGLMGISRLSFNLASHKQLLAVLGRVHHRFKTPYVAIIVSCLLSILVLSPGLANPVFFTDLGASYVFGSLLCFALAHAAILALRARKPELVRPFKLRVNAKNKRTGISRNRFTRPSYDFGDMDSGYYHSAL
jgi:APA family basic amino acid/polyamine antiporter